MKLLFKNILRTLALTSLTYGSALSQDSNALDNDSIVKSINVIKSDVDELKKLKVSGWIQSQYQWTDLKGTKNFDGGDFQPNSNNRFMIRRGRVKFTYTNKLTQYVFQLNGTERGVNIVDIYGKFTEPWSKSFSITAGIMNRPFGFEIEQSSSVRETPERSRFNQTLMPNERDLGAMISFEPVKGKKLHGLKVDAGFYNGTGIAVPGTSPGFAWVNDFDNYKDFIGKAHYIKSFNNEKFILGIGLSHYNGGVLYQNDNVYNSITTITNGTKIWTLADTSNGKNYKGGKAPRIYYGADLQMSLNTKLGKTTIRGEYVTGTQTGTISSTKSPAGLPGLPDSYIRTFDAGYFYFIHRIGKTKHEIAIKYEWYDPNKKLAGNELISANGMTDAELKYTMLGLGYNLYVHDNVKFMFHYNIVMNEVSQNLTGYNNDLNDNILTVRMQYKF